MHSFRCFKTERQSSCSETHRKWHGMVGGQLADPCRHPRAPAVQRGTRTTPERLERSKSRAKSRVSWVYLVLNVGLASVIVNYLPLHSLSCCPECQDQDQASSCKIREAAPTRSLLGTCTDDASQDRTSRSRPRRGDLRVGE